MPCKNEGIETMCKILENPIAPKIKGLLIKKENNKIIGTCVFGEIGVQLHLTDLNMYHIIEELIEIGIPERLVACDYGDSDLSDSILKWNDNTDLTKYQIAQEIREKFGDVE